MPQHGIQSTTTSPTTTYHITFPDQNNENNFSTYYIRQDKDNIFVTSHLDFLNSVDPHNNNQSLNYPDQYCYAAEKYKQIPSQDQGFLASVLGKIFPDIHNKNPFITKYETTRRQQPSAPTLSQQSEYQTPARNHIAGEDNKLNSLINSVLDSRLHTEDEKLSIVQALLEQPHAEPVAAQHTAQQASNENNIIRQHTTLAEKRAAITEKIATHDFSEDERSAYLTEYSKQYEAAKSEEEQHNVTDRFSLILKRDESPEDRVNDIIDNIPDNMPKNDKITLFSKLFDQFNLPTDPIQKHWAIDDILFSLFTRTHNEPEPEEGPFPAGYLPGYRPVTPQATQATPDQRANTNNNYSLTNSHGFSGNRGLENQVIPPPPIPMKRPDSLLSPISLSQSAVADNPLLPQIPHKTATSKTPEQNSTLFKQSVARPLSPVSDYASDNEVSDSRKPNMPNLPPPIPLRTNRKKNFLPTPQPQSNTAPKETTHSSQQVKTQPSLDLGYETEGAILNSDDESVSPPIPSRMSKIVSQAITNFQDKVVTIEAKKPLIPSHKAPEAVVMSNFELRRKNADLGLPPPIPIRTHPDMTPVIPANSSQALTQTSNGISSQLTQKEGVSVPSENTQPKYQEQSKNATQIPTSLSSTTVSTASQTTENSELVSKIKQNQELELDNIQDTKEPHEVLGIEKNADALEINQAYKWEVNALHEKRAMNGALENGGKWTDSSQKAEALLRSSAIYMLREVQIDELEKIKTMEPHKILGIKEGANSRDIKWAYSQQIKALEGKLPMEGVLTNGGKWASFSQDIKKLLDNSKDKMLSAHEILRKNQIEKLENMKKTMKPHEILGIKEEADRKKIREVYESGVLSLYKLTNENKMAGALEDSNKWENSQKEARNLLGYAREEMLDKLDKAAEIRSSGNSPRKSQINWRLLEKLLMSTTN